MKDAIRRHKSMIVPVGILAIGALFVAFTLIPVRSARSVEPNDDDQPACKSTVCETAAGPINFLPGIQTARLTVHNKTDADAMTVMAFINGLTGDVLSKSKPVLLHPHQGVFFDFPATPTTSESSAIQLVGGVRFSRLQGGQGVPFGATLEVIGADDGKTSVFIQLPTSSTPAVRSAWAAESSTWQVQSFGWGTAGTTSR